MRVTVAVATLWTGPERPRPLDAPVLGVPADVRGWVAALTPAELHDELDGRVVTQLLFGEAVLVDEVRDGWARVVAVEQPAPGLDPRGYPGWLPLTQLTDQEPAEPTHLVIAATCTLYQAPDGEPVLDGLALGTKLVAAGPDRDGWLPVCLPDRSEPGWAPPGALAELPAEPTDPGDAVLATAARLVGARYVWGGLSGYGIDCSGLVHLAFRRHGRTLPRDAGDQADATTPVPLGSERPGDLYLFARPGQPVHHIGFVAAPPGPDGRREMLHACGTHSMVLREPMPDARTATLIAAHRVG